MVGIGVTPDVALAQDAGLATENGVLVDAQLRTSDPDVYAVGDIANQQHPVLGRRIRVEHWDTAIQQARVAAANLLGGTAPYDRQPYFFTDQYDLGMEYVGNASGGDEVVIRGDRDALRFTAFWAPGRPRRRRHARERLGRHRPDPGHRRAVRRPRPAARRDGPPHGSLTPAPATAGNRPARRPSGGRWPAQRPSKVGFSLATNAATAAWWSRVAPVRCIIVLSNSSASSKV